jgi:hypothetical protein
MIQKINKNSNVDEIEEYLDSLSITDQDVDFIEVTFKDKLNEDKFFKIKNILNLLDITDHDQQLITKAAKKGSFCSLITCGLLTRLDIVYYVKNDLVTNEDIETVFDEIINRDLADIVLRWKPQLFETTLSKYCEKYSISINMIDESKQKLLTLEKFKFINSI